MMKRSFHLLTAAALAVGVSLAAQSAPEIAYDANADLLKLPDNIHFGEAAGVATNSKGHIFVYTRSGASHATLGTSRTFYKAGSRLFQFDPTGKFVREIGVGVYGFNNAQAVRIDPQDNIWVVDRGSTQVIKFDPDGRIQLVMSRKPEAIAVRAGAPGGAGRGAAPEGRGGPPPEGRGVGAPPPPGGAPAAAAGGGRGPAGPAGVGIPGDSFVRTAGVAWDAQGNLYVADAGSMRIQVFDNNGTFKSEIKNVGNAQAICITPGANQVLYVSNSNPPNDLDTAGEIYKVKLDGSMVGKFGKAGKLPKEFGTVNAIDCRSENTLYVGEVGNFRIQKLTIR